MRTRGRVYAVVCAALLWGVANAQELPKSSEPPVPPVPLPLPPPEPGPKCCWTFAPGGDIAITGLRSFDAKIVRINTADFTIEVEIPTLGKGRHVMKEMGGGQRRLFNLLTAGDRITVTFVESMSMYHVDRSP